MQTGDVDWEGESRWKDDHPVALSLMVFAGMCMLVVSYCLVLTASGHSIGPSVPGIVCALVGGLGGGLTVGRMRRRISQETGLEPFRIPVLTRRIQKERIPVDPAARGAMAVLAERQYRQLRRGRWAWPLIVVFSLLSTVGRFATGPVDAASWVSALCVVIFIGVMFAQWRILHRTERVLAALGQRHNG
jgi:hypothetical protein